MPAPFKFELVSPERLLISSDVVQVDLPGSEGDFGVLAGHSPFMTTLRPGLITILAPEQSKVFVSGGFADVSPAGLTVLAEKAIPVEDLHADVLAAEIRDAEEDVADAATPEAKQAATRRLDQLKAVVDALKAA